jgi:hypothetical protein
MDIFQATAGDFHEGTLFLGGAPIIRLVVEPLILKRDAAAEWEWTAWPVPGPWREPTVEWHGTAASLELAKQRAIGAAMSLFTLMMDADAEAANVIPVGAIQPGREWSTSLPLSG